MVSTKSKINNKITNHECIDIFIGNGYGRKIHKTEMDNTDRFNNELSTTIEFNEIDNINEFVYNFDTSFEKTIERCILKRKVRENIIIRNELRMLKREKIIKYRKALFENSATAWNSYKLIRNIYKVKIGNETN